MQHTLNTQQFYTKVNNYISTNKTKVIYQLLNLTRDIFYRKNAY